MVARAAAEGGADSSTARDKFLELLKKKDGDWRDEEVKAELERLEAANPTPAAALTGDYLDAEWLQVSRPDFNYGSDGSTTYSLGQLSFGMYEPKDMKFRIDRLVQDVAPVTDGEGNRTWDVFMELTCDDDRYPPFKAKMTTFGRVKPSKDEKETQRLEVWFTGGELKPAEGTSADMKEKWMEVFGDSFKNKKWSMRGAFKNWMMGMMMGLRPPHSIEDDGKITFDMKKPPHGYTDILYIDDKLRVTRGNRGSVVVTTRG